MEENIFEKYDILLNCMKSVMEEEYCDERDLVIRTMINEFISMNEIFRVDYIEFVIDKMNKDDLPT